MTSNWTKVDGHWQTKDGRWIAREGWNSIQHRHWVLIIGGSTEYVTSRPTLKEIKELVAEGNPERFITLIEQDYEKHLEILRVRLAEAPTEPYRRHIRRGIEIDIDRTKINLEHFRKAVAEQPGPQENA